MPSVHQSSNSDQFAPIIRTKDITAAGYTLLDDDLLGQVGLLLNNSGSQNLTIDAGLTRKQPLTCINIGAGLWTIVAGTDVTLRSKGSFLRASEQYSAFSIIPHPTTADLYYVVGDLA